jgi:hypothetical protein
LVHNINSSTTILASGSNQQPRLDYVKYIEFNFAVIGLREDGIVDAIFFDDSEIGREECMFLYSAYTRLFKNDKVKLLVKIGKRVTFKKDTFAFARSKIGMSFSYQEAYVVPNFLPRLLGTITIFIYRRNIRSQLFATEEEATKWLLKP